MLDINFETIEEGMEKLQKYVSLRNEMGGALYWNIINDDCLKLADAIYYAGGDKKTIEAVLNS